MAGHRMANRVIDDIAIDSGREGGTVGRAKRLSQIGGEAENYRKGKWARTSPPTTSDIPPTS